MLLSLGYFLRTDNSQNCQKGGFGNGTIALAMSKFNEAVRAFLNNARQRNLLKAGKNYFLGTFFPFDLTDTRVPGCFGTTISCISNAFTIF